MRLRTVGTLLAAGALCATLGTTPAHAFLWPNVSDQIANALTSGEVTDRRIAAGRLTELPHELALPLVARGLGDPDIEVRLKVASAAVVLRMPKAGDTVIPWLSEGDVRLRLAACDVIRTSPTERSVVALGRVLGDPDAHVRHAAAAAMGSSLLAVAVSPLLGHLDDTSPEVRGEVARALGRIGDPRAALPLIGKVQDSVPEVRRTVARALGELGEPRAAAALMLALQDASGEVRLEAVTALGRLRTDEGTLAIASLAQVDSGDDAFSGMIGRPSNSASASSVDVRVAALRALGRIASPAAVRALVTALAKDDPTATSSAVRDALVAAGKPSVRPLIAALAGSPTQNTASGAVLVLGELHAMEAAQPIVRAMQRGAVPLRFGLSALGTLGASSAIPTVLELLDDNDPAVRREAISATTALLDPRHPDGRPVDPASALLRDGATPLDEKVGLIRLLGKTGAPRAKDVLLPLATAKLRSVRWAALEALGLLGAGADDIDKVLLKGLDDDDASVRMGAAIALGRVGMPAVANPLLDRLTVAAEQDRGALGVALSGVLSRAKDPAIANAVGAAIATAPESARDALIEGLGRMKGEDAGKALERIAGGGLLDRRKVAEALGGHPERVAALRGLAADADAGVRANAVWSLGRVGEAADLARLATLVTDADAAVAGNAAGAIGRLASRLAPAASPTTNLCTALGDVRPYVRANALASLAATGATCETTSARELLVRDPSESVRLAAADLVGAAVEKAGASPNPADVRALVRCSAEDRNATVAERCTHPSHADVGTEDIAVYVVADGGSTPAPKAPFALVRPDGLMRLGVADRRGELFEAAAPRGMLRLAVPAALAR